MAHHPSAPIQAGESPKRFFNLMYYTWTLVGVWTLIVAGLLAKEHMDISKYTNEIALNTARANLNKDKSFRFWASLHGGVYVPVSKDTPPNPYLFMIKDRDITTSTGRRLTLMNPEYMLRNLNETFSELYGVAGHITSKKPLRPENGPDPWETEALTAFEHGAKEVIEIVKDKEGEPVLRLMQPLYVKPECLKCHGHQGYHVGDIRGGVGIKLPMRQFIKHGQEQLLLHTASLIVLWILGVAGIVIGSEKLRKSTSALAYSNLDLQREVEERKKAEDAVKKESSFTSAVIDTAGALIVVLDEAGRVIRFNRTCEQITGYAAGEVTGRSFWELLLTDDDAHAMAQAFDRLQSEPFPAKVKNNLRTRDGKHRIIDWSNTTFPAGGDRVEYVISIGIDITEERMLTMQLMHAEKLSAVGTLSASIAHEINHPLFGIRNVLDRIREKAGLDADNLEFVELAVKECDRIKDLIRDLQDFNRPTSGVKTPINLHAGIDNMLLLSKKELKRKGITVRRDYAPEITEITAVADQIKQVFLNLINNAMEAIEENGTITITTRRRDDCAVIEISDTGAGIKPEDMDHIFEPFFTTKAAVKGTGLGLSVTYGIIKSHHGDITVGSTPGEGTTFTITLPIEGKDHG